MRDSSLLRGVFEIGRLTNMTTETNGYLHLPNRPRRALIAAIYIWYRANMGSPQLLDPTGDGLGLWLGAVPVPASQTHRPP